MQKIIVKYLFRQRHNEAWCSCTPRCCFSWNRISQTGWLALYLNNLLLYFNFLFHFFHAMKQFFLVSADNFPNICTTSHCISYTRTTISSLSRGCDHRKDRCSL